MFHISMVCPTLQEDCPDNQQAIQQLLQEYADVFDEPRSLPPHRKLDHEIHLLPSVAPVNGRP